MNSSTHRRHIIGALAATLIPVTAFASGNAIIIPLAIQALCMLSLIAVLCLLKMRIWKKLMLFFAYVLGIILVALATLDTPYDAKNRGWINVTFIGAPIMAVVVVFILVDAAKHKRIS